MKQLNNSDALNGLQTRLYYPYTKIYLHFVIWWKKKEFYILNFSTRECMDFIWSHFFTIRIVCVKFIFDLYRSLCTIWIYKHKTISIEKGQWTGRYLSIISFRDTNSILWKSVDVLYVWNQNQNKFFCSSYNDAPTEANDIWWKRKISTQKKTI